jgi:signal transduction histidine kinase
VMVAVAFTAAALFLFFWRRHRRVVAAASLRQSNTESRFTEMERQLRTAHRERELIAQELHDNIIQSIYSVGLGLDEARRLAEKNPERLPERLNLAVGSLNSVIRDVRAFLGGLEPRGLDGRELKAALKSVLLASGDDQQARFSIRIDPSAANALTTAQATEVFNIAKEAMMNAMRHANAALTTVTLLATSRGGVRLEIEDNGAGFNPEKLERDSLGLRHMQQRAQDMGATWRLDAELGRGTRIIVEISASPLLTLPANDDNK